MKTCIILCDGMADRPCDIFNGKTPMMAAEKPNMDALARCGSVGLMRTLYPELPTGSDVANLSVLGYDPHNYYTGRSPIEALGLGIPLEDGVTVFRMNLVCVSDDEPFEEKTMLDHSSDKITTPEAAQLVEALAAEFASDTVALHPGVSYRHVFILKGSYSGDLTPPHDILEQKITKYLPKGDYSAELLGMMKRSYEILSTHPVNIERVRRGLRPANCLWLWGSGGKPKYDSFYSKHGVRTGTVITAVPLIKGLAAGMGLASVDVEGATGDYYTNYAGKAAAAISAFDSGSEFVFVHIEAPDECGHDGDAPLKKASIEQIDRNIVGPLHEYLASAGGDWRLLVTPDHATPVSVRTHTSEPIPFVLAGTSLPFPITSVAFDELAAQASGIYVSDAFTLLDRILGR